MHLDRRQRRLNDITSTLCTIAVRSGITTIWCYVSFRRKFQSTTIRTSESRLWNNNTGVEDIKEMFFVCLFVFCLLRWDFACLLGCLFVCFVFYSIKSIITGLELEFSACWSQTNVLKRKRAWGMVPVLKSLENESSLSCEIWSTFQSIYILR